MIRPFHILVATILLSVWSLFYPGMNFMLNEFLNLLMVIGLFNHSRKSIIDKTSIYALLTLNTINLAALSISIVHHFYAAIFSLVCCAFIATIFYLKINERFDK